MYIPSKYDQPDLEKQLDLIRTNPFGTLISVGNDDRKLQATHLPFILVKTGEDADPQYLLRAHIARANQQCGDLDYATVNDPEKEFLVIFQGPNDYVTPSWYVETKPATHKTVPTWDYSSVHVYGTVKLIKNTEWILKQAGQLTDEREADFEKKWSLEEAPEAYRQLKAKAIFGVEISIKKMEASWKYSQEAKPVDNQGVIDGFKSVGTEHTKLMADKVQECRFQFIEQAKSKTA